MFPQSANSGWQNVIKGILDIEDAKAAVKVGADDRSVQPWGTAACGAMSSIEALPAVDAVGNKAEVWMDSGIRSGKTCCGPLRLVPVAH